MGDALLSGLMGGLQGVTRGLQIRQEMQEKELRQQWQSLTMLYEQGDEKIRGIAAEGLADMAQKGLKYKGNHIQLIRDYMTEGVAPGGIPEAGSVVPAAGSAAPPSSFGAGPAGAAGPPGPPPPAAQAPQALTAALPATSPTAATGSSAGQPPGGPPAAVALPVSSAAPGAPPAPTAPTGGPGPQAAPAGPQPYPGLAPALEQFKSAAGLEPPGPAPTRDELSAQAAAEFGYSAKDLEDPGFSGKLVDPQKQRIQQEYRGRVAQSSQRAESEHAAATRSYEAKIAGFVAQYTAGVATGKRADKRAEASDTRRDKSARDIEGRRAKAAKAADTARADQALRVRLRNAEKLRNPTDDLLKARLMTDPGLADRWVQEARDRAFDDYEMFTGEAAPGRGPSRGSQGPPGAGGVRRASQGAGLAGPPSAPISAAEESRAAQIIQKYKRQGAGIEDLSPEDRSFLQDFYRRGGQFQVR